MFTATLFLIIKIRKQPKCPSIEETIRNDIIILFSHKNSDGISQTVSQFSCSVVSDYLWSHGPQYTRLPCPSPTSGACSNSCPLSWWCHPTISSSVVPFSSCLQLSLASGSFLVSQFFTSGVQSIGVSTSASALPMNIQDWFPLG